MRKKIFAILVCGLLVFSVTACGTNKDNQSRGTNKTESFNAEKIEKNISITEQAKTLNNDIAYVVKNNNNETVYIQVEAVFYDADGNVLGSDNDYMSIYNKQEMAGIFSNAPDNYSTYKINIKASESYYTNYSNKLETTHNNTGEQITVQVANKADTTIDSVDIVVLFYNGNQLVGASRDYQTDLRTDGTATSNIYYPYDANYDDITFDSYTVYVSGYTTNI